MKNNIKKLTKSIKSLPCSSYEKASKRYYSNTGNAL